MMKTKPVKSQQNPDGTVYGLNPGQQYHVVKSFTDYYSNFFTQGEILRFKQRHFLPHEGGHTIVFDERTLYLREDVNQEILDHFTEYIVLVAGQSMIVTFSP